MLVLRKDLERRQQLLSVLNQQINVVSTHLHNLELVQQGQVASLPNTDEMTADAVKAEEVLAELEANAELAATVGSIGAGSGMSGEEQEFFEELERETGTAAVPPRQESCRVDGGSAPFRSSERPEHSAAIQWPNDSRRTVATNPNQDTTGSITKTTENTEGTETNAEQDGDWII